MKSSPSSIPNRSRVPARQLTARMIAPPAMTLLQDLEARLAAALASHPRRTRVRRRHRRRRPALRRLSVERRDGAGQAAQDQPARAGQEIIDHLDLDGLATAESPVRDSSISASCPRPTPRAGRLLRRCGSACPPSARARPWWSISPRRTSPSRCTSATSARRSSATRCAASPVSSASGHRRQPHRRLGHAVRHDPPRLENLLDPPRWTPTRSRTAARFTAR
jgi:hypothetical protein